MSRPVAEAMNLSCGCVTTDRGTLGVVLDGTTEDGFFDRLRETHPHLFADQAIFVTHADVDAMAGVIEAVERVAALPAYVDAALAGASDVVRRPTRTRGVFFGYDFHLTDDGPRLIEINTNAGGALLQTALARAQHPCCPPVREHFEPPFDPDEVETGIVEMFRKEHALETGGAELHHVAIVDEQPESQFLRPEFELFARLFASAGIAASVCDPSALGRRDGRLFVAGDSRPVDLVYLRSTDFGLSGASHAVLAESYLAGEVTVTPAPRTHRLFADKRNLITLSDASALRALGASEADVATLIRGVPETRLVRPSDHDALWAHRGDYFFKPSDGFGSRAAYRGDKLTRRVFGDILASERGYVAQRLVAPSERVVDTETERVSLKADIRAFAYAGRIMLVAGRLYRGQTTNMRTPHGGLAAVICPTVDE